MSKESWISTGEKIGTGIGFLAGGAGRLAYDIGDGIQMDSLQTVFKEITVVGSTAAAIGFFVLAALKIKEGYFPKSNQELPKQ